MKVTPFHTQTSVNTFLNLHLKFLNLIKNKQLINSNTTYVNKLMYFICLLCQKLFKWTTNNRNRQEQDQSSNSRIIKVLFWGL